MRHLLLALPLLALACEGKTISLGQGSPEDARFIADLFTWDCATQDTGGSTVAEWQGVFGYELALEYAPDALPSRDLPASGCTKGIDLFPADAGGSAVDLDSSPSWKFNADLYGSLGRVTTGFYRDDAFDNQNTCYEAQDMLADGTLLENAGGFSGARTPSAGAFEDVSVSSGVDGSVGIPYGSDIDVTWTASDWQSSWVQIRREDASGALVESVTCNTTGETSYAIDSDVWGLFSSAVETPVTNLYVGVQSSDTTETEDGQKIETLTRAIHVAVIHD